MKTKNTIYLWVAACLMAIPGLLQAQLADISFTVRVGNVFSSEFGNNNPITNCQEAGAEEYTAYAGFSDDVNTSVVASSCMTCDNNGDCNYGGGTPLGSRTNNAYFLNYHLDAWEDDGASSARCSFNSGDDCRYNGSPGGIYLREVAGPSNNTYSGVASPNLGNRHRLTLDWTWKYAGTANLLSPVCSAQNAAYSLGAIRSWSLNLIAGRTYRFSTNGLTAEDTWIRIHGSDGYTLVANNDDISGSNRQSQVDFTPATSGTYYLEVSSYVRNFLASNGSVSYQDISAPAVNGGSIASSTTICTGGSVNLSSVSGASGGFDANYSYQWESSTNNSTWSAIANATSATYNTPALAGTTYYRRKATDCKGTEGFSNVVTVTVVADPVVSLSSAAPNGVVCTGGSTLLTASGSGGTGSLVYQWQQFSAGSWQFIPGASGSTFNAGPGSTTDYRVLVSTNVSGCNANATNTITVVADPTLQVSGTNVTCNGLSNGSASAILSGGTSGNSYSYSWSNGQTGSSLSGLSAGQYSVTASGSYGCNAQGTVNISQPASLVATASAGSIACKGGTTTITVSAIGGTAPYSGTGSFSMGAGSYSYTVTDANGCSDVVYITVTEPATLDASASAGTILCNGGTTTITVSAVGGAAPYAGTGSFTVGAGSYSYTVTDANGCSDVVNVTVAEPTALEASASATDILCNGGTSIITVSATGGTAPYTGTGFNYVGAGTYNYTVTDANGCSDQVNVTVTEPVRLVATATAGTILCNGGTTTVTVGGLGGTAPYIGTGTFNVSAGSHSFTVTDANGCTDVVNISISEPSALEASVVSGSILCNGGTTTIVVGATGGTAPYNGVGTFTVGAGSYSYTITDANGCTDVVNITVTEPAALEASVSSGTILCNGGTTTVSVSATGGTAPYIGTGSNMVGAGTYTYTIVDANGCTDQVSITVTEPTQVMVSTLSSNVSCNGAADGSATASGSGGTGNIAYTWSNGATTASISGLVPGTYDVTATDANGCTAVASVTITEPAALAVNGGSDQVIYLGYSASCVTLGPEQVSGGTGPYVSGWSDASGQVSATVCPTTTTTYTFTVVDANGCVATDEVTVCVVDVRCAGGNNNGQGGNGQGGQGSTNGNGIEHVLICHIPPGNPNNAMTKCIPVSAVAGHLSHGDYLGACGTVVACHVAPISGQSSQSASRTSGGSNVRLGASPNPSSGISNIELTLPSTGRVSLRVYDSRGVMVADLFQGMANAEQAMRFEWNAEGLAAGLYFVRLEMMAGEVETLRLMLNP